MEFFYRSWAQIRVMFGQLSITARWLLVTLTVLMFLVLYLVIVQAGKPEMVAVHQFASERQSEAVARLQQAGITVETRGGMIYVPQAKEVDALVVLQRADLMNMNTAAAFDDLIARQNPWMTDRQNQQAFLLAKMKVLSQIVGKMGGVQNAQVLVSPPEDRGFGRSTVRPSASVNLVMQGGKRVDKALVGAVAGLVAGAVAGMTPEDVTVIDAAAGRQFTVKSGSEQWPSEALELVQQIEEYKRQQIQETLSYIPGVIVAVNVITDPTRTKQIESVEFEKSEPIKRERTRETERRDVSAAGAPGARSNNGLDIEGSGGGSGSTEKTTEAESEFGSKQPVRKVSAVETGHTVQQIHVTVNVPRNYFAGLFKKGKTDATEPDEATLQPFAQQYLAQIEGQVSPLVNAAEKGVVKAYMVPDRGMFEVAGVGGGGIAGTAGGSGIAAYLGGEWFNSILVVGVAVVAVVVMLGMVRKATQAPPMPTAQELAGLPPTLPAEEELVGEADESATTMPGVELDEDDIRHRKIAEQIADMIRHNPVEAAQLMRRWVRTED